MVALAMALAQATKGADEAEPLSPWEDPNYRMQA